VVGWLATIVVTMTDPGEPHALGNTDIPGLGASAPSSGASGPSSLTATPLQVVPLRYPGRWVLAVVILGLTAALLLSLLTNDNINWLSETANGKRVEGVWYALWKPSIRDGVKVTLLLTVVSMLFGLILGTISAVWALSTNVVLRTISTVFTWFFRGTPLLVQIIFWFNLALLFPRLGIPFVQTWDTNDVITPFIAAALALSLNEGAYMSEIVRAGIQSVDRGQTEAAQSLGMTPILTMRRIVLPQAMRVIIPPTGNETISMLKSTSLVSAIAARDLLTEAQLIYTRNFQVIDYLIAASLWYLFLTSLMTIAQRFIERRYGKGFNGGAPQVGWMGRMRGVR
jgi:polar amino acid transport system permease protein